MLLIKTKSVLIVVIAAVLLMSIPIVNVDGDDSSSMVLYDQGNGNTEWVEAEAGATYGDVLRMTAEANSISYNISGTDLIVYGVGPITIGEQTGSGGSMSDSGTTGNVVNSAWTAYLWDQDAGEWTSIPDLDAEYQSEHLALAFYPSGYKPVETPDHPSSWTMIRGNAEQTGHQDNVTIQSYEAQVDWSVTRGGTSGVYSSVLYVENYIFVKFGASNNLDAAVICYELDGSNDPESMKRWEFLYDGQASYETSTPVIVGEYIYIQIADGYIYGMSWKEGPGAIIDGEYEDVIVSEMIPQTTIPLEGDSYGPGPGSMVYDSGAIYLTSNNGMIYCFDLDLELVWSSQMNGYTYYISPTISGDYLFTGARDGNLYVVNKTNGTIVAQEDVYHVTISGKDYGNVSAPVVFRSGNVYTVMFTVSDGRGMNSATGGVGVYQFDASNNGLTKISLNTSAFGLVSNYVLPVDTPEFKGIYLVGTKGVFRVDTNGVYQLLNDELYSIKAPPILVNGDSIYLVSYSPNRPIYELDLNGNILSLWVPNSSVRNYAMAPLLFVGGTLFYANDAGLVATSGTLPEYVPPLPADGAPIWMVLLYILIVILAILAIVYAFLRFVKGVERPFSYLRKRMSDYVGSEELRHNARSKHRLLVVMIGGMILTIVIFITCLCVGPTVILSIPDMFSSLFSAISKGGQGLDYNELMVYESRLPRTIAALGVGIGLSVAGCMYQAVIRNPLVDPYIMGVSAGAGTAAVAVIAFDFTMFGLFASHSIYITACVAIIGGIIAFFATMLIAEKSGGASLNYVLAGVVIGLAFSAMQTLMLSMAGQNVSNALSWLFGSFANVSWNQVWLILIPAISLSLVPLIWAKEFNLVLLGEDQAQQMGLNVRRFNRIMLILASVLTSICVAFVGIIGFVGLVVPHLCRMMLGGDHRLVLPASIAFGGALMMAADLIARIAYYGQELPVGAITTIIGVPVFAYLLIKRGRLYEG